MTPNFWSVVYFSDISNLYLWTSTSAADFHEHAAELRRHGDLQRHTLRTGQNSFENQNRRCVIEIQFNKQFISRHSI